MSKRHSLSLKMKPVGLVRRSTYGVAAVASVCWVVAVPGSLSGTEYGVLNFLISGNDANNVDS